MTSNTVSAIGWAAAFSCGITPQRCMVLGWVRQLEKAGVTIRRNGQASADFRGNHAFGQVLAHLIRWKSADPALRGYLEFERFEKLTDIPQELVSREFMREEPSTTENPVFDPLQPLLENSFDALSEEMRQVDDSQLTTDEAWRDCAGKNRRLADLAHRLDKGGMEILALRRASRAYIQVGEAAVGLTLIRRALPLFEILYSKERIARELDAFGGNLVAAGIKLRDPNIVMEGISLVERAVPIYEELDDKQSLAFAFTRLGWALYERSKGLEANTEKASALLKVAEWRDKAAGLFAELRLQEKFAENMCYAGAALIEAGEALGRPQLILSGARKRIIAAEGYESLGEVMKQAYQLSYAASARIKAGSLLSSTPLILSGVALGVEAAGLFGGVGEGEEQAGGLSYMGAAQVKVGEKLRDPDIILAGARLRKKAAAIYGRLEKKKDQAYELSYSGKAQIRAGHLLEAEDGKEAARELLEGARLRAMAADVFRDLKDHFNGTQNRSLAAKAIIDAGYLLGDASVLLAGADMKAESAEGYRQSDNQEMRAYDIQSMGGARIRAGVLSGDAGKIVEGVRDRIEAAKVFQEAGNKKKRAENLRQAGEALAYIETKLENNEFMNEIRELKTQVQAQIMAME